MKTIKIIFLQFLFFFTTMLCFGAECGDGADCCNPIPDYYVSSWTCANGAVVECEYTPCSSGGGGEGGEGEETEAECILIIFIWYCF